MRCYEYHPFSNLFPLLEGAAFGELVADVQQRGLLQPIVLFDDMILDGRNRYRACLAANVPCRFEVYTGIDPLGEVISLNVRRRQLTSGQRSIVAARMATLNQGQRRSATAIAVSQDDAAKLLAVSVDNVQRARKVLEHGTHMLIRAVEHNEISVSQAATIAELRTADQDRYLSGDRADLPSLGDIKAKLAQKRKIEKLLENSELELYPPEEFRLSLPGRQFERVLLKDLYAPLEMKLPERERTVIGTIVERMPKLREIARRINEPGALEDFEAEFLRMECAVDLLVGPLAAKTSDQTVDDTLSVA